MKKTELVPVDQRTTAQHLANAETTLTITAGMKASPDAVGLAMTIQAQIHATMALAAAQHTANLLAFYATAGTRTYNDAHRQELRTRLGIPEPDLTTPHTPQETETIYGGDGKVLRTDEIPAAPTMEDIEAEIEATARDLWKADPGNNSPARSFDEDYAVSQDRYLTMARAALGLTDEKKENKK